MTATGPPEPTSKSVLMIAYGFPPEGNAGAYRPLRFVRQLSDAGWRTSVIAAAPSAYERFDPETMNLVPRDTRVTRVPARDLWQQVQSTRESKVKTGAPAASPRPPAAIPAAEQRSVRAWARERVRTAEAWWYHPDMAMPWIRPAVAACMKECTHDKPAVIWATAGPVSSFVVAEQVSQRTGVPYVVDFRDAWTITGNDFEDRRPAWAIAGDRRAMYRYLKDARSVVFLYETMAQCYWQAYPGALDSSRVHIIPNAFEGKVAQHAAPLNDRCTLLYGGTLSSYRYDTLLQALRLLKETDPDRAARLRVMVVGESADALAGEVAVQALGGVVDTRGTVSRAEIDRFQEQADALLILGRDRAMKGHELFVGAKFFDYLKRNKPIVGVLPPDETTRILRHVGVATVASADSPAEIVSVLVTVIDAWSQGTLAALAPNAEACAEYSAERQTRELIAALEGRPSAGAFVPGRTALPNSLRTDILQRQQLAQSASQ